MYATLNGIDKNKLQNDETKDFPYITRTEFLNGLDMFVSEQHSQRNSGNVVTIGLDTQTVFYQPYDFYTGQNIQVLSVNQLTREVGLFLVPLIKKQLETLSWGGNGATLGRLKKKKIILPVDGDGQPDWHFIRIYIQNRIIETKKKIKLPNMHAINDHRELHEVDFLEFSIGQLFKLSTGKSKGLNHLVKNGRTPYLGATHRKNGVLDFVQDDDHMKHLGNCIAFIRNGEGSMGYSIYKQEPFVSTSDISLGYNPNLNRYTGTFITTIADQVRGKYNFGYKRSGTRLKKEILLLPAIDSATPDWGFMEQYMKRQENKILERIQPLL